MRPSPSSSAASTGAHSSGAVLLEHEFRNEFATLKTAKYLDAHDALADLRTAGYVETYLKPNNILSMNPVACMSGSRHFGMLKMLRRLIGEDIDLVWLPGRELWPVRLDPSQVDQILANLCVNARDAIGGVGKVTLETENVTLDKDCCARHAGFTPGDYVLLAVSDWDTRVH